MDIKQLCLDMMSSSKYRNKGISVDKYEELLNIQGAEQFKELMKALNELEDECVFVRDRRDRYFFAEELGYVKGILKVNPKGFGFIDTDDGSWYVNRESMNLALNNDVVFAQTKAYPDGSTEAVVVRILERNTKNVIGTIKVKDGRKFFLPDSNFNDHTFTITNMEDFKVVNDSKVLVVITKYGKTLKAKIERVIGYKYDPGVDILSVLLEHNIEPEFPEAVLEELKSIPETVQEEDRKGRVDCTNELIITIDGEDARDLDDAISIEKLDGSYRLSVHIADVSYYVREGTELNAEAYQRGTSVYVADRVVPMLPHYLSNGICSLNPKVERCAMTCDMIIDLNGTIQSYKIYPSIIKTTERMTYTAVNKIIDGDEETCAQYPHLLEMVKNMLSLSKIIRTRREGLGAIDFDTREGKIILDEQGRPIDVVLRERGIAERIIEDFMIQANECVAAHVKWMETPSVYRIHEQPEPKKMRDFVKTANIMGYKFKGNVMNLRPKQCQQMLEDAKGTPEYPVLSVYLLRCMAKARYDAKPIGHFGLALTDYTHFTSPIRRYPDLIVHRMLRKYYINGVTDSKVMANDEKWVEKAAIQCSDTEVNAVMAERDVDDMKKAEYMEKHIGEEFDGIISSVTKFGIFVELPNTIEGLVHISNLEDHYDYDEDSRSLLGRGSGTVLKMGMAVRVKVLDASRFKKQVDFQLVNEKGIKTKKNKDKKEKNLKKPEHKAKKGKKEFDKRKRK